MPEIVGRESRERQVKPSVVDARQRMGKMVPFLVQTCNNVLYLHVDRVEADELCHVCSFC